MPSPSIIVNTGRLSPLSVGIASLVQAGTDALQQIELIQLQQNAYVFNIIADPFPSAGAQVDHLQTGTSTLQDIQRITLSPMPYDGTFDFTLNGVTYTQIPYNISGKDLQAILGNGFQVAKRASNAWDIMQIATGALTLAAVDVSKLVVPEGVKGTLGLNNMAIYLAFIASQADVLTFRLEVQLVWPGQDPQTIFQAPIEISRNVINLATLRSATTLGLQSAYTAIFGGIAATWSTAISALTGGGTALDGVPTAGLALGARYDFPLNGKIQSWVLKAGAADTGDPTGQVPPLDYDAGSNNKHWEMEG
jgi:hypothetical protein